MIRFSKKYTLDEIYSRITGKVIIIDGQPVKMNSQRYRLFRRDGTKCVRCQREGQFFYLEKHNLTDNRYHFNLYAELEDGKLLLFTKDHILPSSKGGKDVMSNYQVMCQECNNNKGNKLETNDSNSYSDCSHIGVSN